MKLHTQKLRQLGACKDALDFVEQFDTFAEAQKACTNLGWFEWLFNKLKLYEEYERVTASAWAEYLRVTNPAYEEYLRVKNSALKEYHGVSIPALKEYLRVRNSALKEYQRVVNSAWEEYLRTILPLLQTFSLKDYIL